MKRRIKDEDKNKNNGTIATFQDAYTFFQIVDAIRELIPSVTFHFQEDKIVLSAMDTSHIAIVSLIINGSKLEKYEHVRNLAVSLDLDKVANFLKGMDHKESKLTFYVEEEDFVDISITTKSIK